MLQLRCYERIQIGNRRVWRGGTVWPKISGRRACPPSTISSCHKTRCLDLSYGVRMWTEVSFVLSQFTHFDTDGQMLIARACTAAELQHSKTCNVCSTFILGPILWAVWSAFEILIINWNKPCCMSGKGHSWSHCSNWCSVYDCWWRVIMSLSCNCLSGVRDC